VTHISPAIFLLASPTGGIPVPLFVITCGGAATPFCFPQVLSQVLHLQQLKYNAARHFLATKIVKKTAFLNN
jgi:hypothetical protein